ncbi:hypothetical protein ACYSNR_03180 [Enterococcus sp. LJL128]
MTEQKEQVEKTPIYQEDKLIGYCTRVSLSEINEGLDVEYRYTIKDFEAVKDEPVQSAFKVGEYYSFNNENKKEIFKVLEINNGRMIVNSYRVNLDMFNEYSSYTDGNAIAVTDSKIATTDEIALFKRAEHFRSKGRKLDEIKAGDLIEYDNQFIIAGHNTSSGYVRVKISNFKRTIAEMAEVNLIMTAEELALKAQEVEG